MTQQHPFTSPQITPEARALLLDRETVARAYACDTVRGAGKRLGVGQKTMERALDYHGIPRRQRGEKPPGQVGQVLTRATVRRLVFRAYANSDRCPPDCPGRERCLDPGEKCVLGEIVG